MTRYIAARLLLLAPVLLGVSIASFSVIHLIPGDPAVVLGGTQATQADLEGIRREFGLNDPLPVQYARYVVHALHGNLGISIRTREPVAPLLLTRLIFTLKLTLLSTLLAVVLGVLAGIIAATHENSWADTGLMVVTLAGISMPSFWRGLLLLLIFGGTVAWLPATGAAGISVLILPAVALASSAAAVIARMTRSSLIEVLHDDYVRTARAKGVAEYRIIYKHALKNALNPVLTVVGLEFGYLLAGAVVIETIFSLPGMGQLLVTAIFSRDYPVIQGGMLLVATTFVTVNLLTDLAYAAVNPRVLL